MQITVTFSDEEQHEFLHMMNAYNFSSSIDDVYNYCRTKLKHGLCTPKGELVTKDQEDGSSFAMGTGKVIVIPEEAYDFIIQVLEDIQEMVTDAYNKGNEQ